MTSEQDRINWLRLTRTPKIGPTSFFYLLSHFGSVKKALDSLSDFSSSLGGKKQITPLRESIAIEEYSQHKKLGGEIITFEDDAYPVMLKNISDPPPVLSVLGGISLLNKNLFAIVGSRNASAAGISICKNITKELSMENVIVSGMAQGIDREAHVNTLNTRTIAVLAGGIDHIYPETNHDLYHKIKESGLILSEMPLKMKVNSGIFSRRNRIIAGLSWGILVIEAALNSGSLTTANFALEYGREVFAIPGHPMDIRSRGVNKLIKEGATLVENADDILNSSLPFVYSQNSITPTQEVSHSVPAGDKEMKRSVLEVLTTTPIDINILAERYGYPVSLLRACVIELHIAGRVHFCADKVSIIIE